ncbi:cation:proton antiporter [Brachybacterium huguangmaarense]
MLTIALLVGMLAATVACVAVAERVHLPYPILILVVSAGIAFIPGFPHLEVPSDVILPLFLPPLLFATAQHTSWGVFRARWRSLLVLALGLTAVTAFAVAGIAWALVPGIGIPLALMLGAMVAPPDPIAVDAVAEPARMPRRLVSVLQTEGLFNDAIAIVLFQAALGAVVSGESLGPMIAVRFVVGAVLAVGVGFLVGWLFRVVDRPLTSLAARTALGVVAPFAAYMLAEELHASGVIAVVVTALETRRGARAEDGELRMTRTAFWNVANLLITGIAFGLIGVELRDVIAEEGAGIVEYAGPALAVAAVVVLVRLAGTRVLNLATARSGNTIPSDWREGLVLTWCGMRGLATLALALAIPLEDAGHHDLSGYRNLMIVVATTVLVVTLVPTGILLPWLLRVLGMQDDGRATFEQTRELGERAQTAAIAALRERLPELHLPDDQRDALLARLKRLQYDLAPSPALTGSFPVVRAEGSGLAGRAGGAGASGAAAGGGIGASEEEAGDLQAEELRRARMRAARDLAVAAQTVALDAARAEVLAARGEPGIDPAAADIVLTRLDRRMMAVPPTRRGGHGGSRRSGSRRRHG